MGGLPGTEPIFSNVCWLAHDSTYIPHRSCAGGPTVTWTCWPFCLFIGDGFLPAALSKSAPTPESPKNTKLPITAEWTNILSPTCIEVFAVYRKSRCAYGFVDASKVLLVAIALPLVWAAAQLEFWVLRIAHYHRKSRRAHAFDDATKVLFVVVLAIASPPTAKLCP